MLYKSVDKKANPVPAVLPEQYKVKRRFPEDPLASFTPLTPFPVDFVPSARLTDERLATLHIFDNEFLWPKEQRLAMNIIMFNDEAIAFTAEERGTL